MADRDPTFGNRPPQRTPLSLSLSLFHCVYVCLQGPEALSLFHCVCVCVCLQSPEALLLFLCVCVCVPAGSGGTGAGGTLFFHLAQVVDDPWEVQLQKSSGAQDYVWVRVVRVCEEGAQAGGAMPGCVSCV